MARVARGAALGLATAGTGALAWWDNGHMLVAQVAKELLTNDEVSAINGVLGNWEADYPGASEMVTAAVWPDLIKCTHVTDYCHKPLPDALEEFEGWHFSDRAYNPDGLPLTEMQTAVADSDPSATWMLQQAMTTFTQSQSRFAFNLMLRFAIHVVGDIHQPLHASQGFFDDATFGHLVNGDRGGNSIYITSPPTFQATNLHALWDAGAGLYLYNWPLTDEQKAQLASNASDLISKYPSSSFPDYNAADMQSCVSTMLKSGGNPCGNVFIRWANGSHMLAVSEAYGHGIASHTQPSAEYLANAQEVSRRQIALGGYRLADLLRAIVPKLPTAVRGDVRGEKPLIPGSQQPNTPLEIILGCMCAVLSLAVAGLAVALRVCGKEAQRREMPLQQREQLLVETERVQAPAQV